MRSASRRWSAGRRGSPAGAVSNEIIQHHDWLPTFLAAAGEPDIVEKLKAGHMIGGTTYKVHIDGYNLLPYLTGEVDRSPRQGLIYFSDDGDVLALRFDNWKVVFMEQRVQGTLQIWAEPFVALRVPKLYNLRTDPFERADITSNTYYDWLIDTASSSSPRPRSPRSSSRPSRSSRHARRRPRSASTRSSRSSRARSPRGDDRDAAGIGHGLGAGGDVPDGLGRPHPEEAPVHPVTVSGFWIDRHQVTNRDFAAFVADTDYVTVAERPLDPADYPGAPAANLAPGSLVFTRTADAVDLRHLSQWWTWTPKALPTEAQWELAARGGHDGAVYTWGDEPEPPGDALANYWHGAFPWRPDPGYGSTARVGSYAANGYGLYDMAGNVWEWTTDWYSPRHSDAAEHACCVPVDPRGDAVRDSLDPGQPQFAVPRKVIKGGSFLCADSYCMRREASSESIPIAPLGRIMRLLSGSSSQAFALMFDDSVGARPLVRARETPTAVQSLIAAAIAPMVAVTIWLALTNDHLQRPEAAGVYWSYLTASSMLIGVYWWIRRPASRFGPLLVAFGILVWIVSWQAADSPLLFDVAVLAEAPFFVLTFYLFLAFPMGRLEPRAARWLMGALGLGVLAFFVPWALFSPVIAGGGPLTSCAPGCPENVLQVGSAPTVVEVAGKAETYTALAITAAVLVVYLARLRAASRPQRRALVAVAVTSLLFLPAYFIFNFSAWILELDPSTLDTMAWGIVGARVLLPLGFLVALLFAEWQALTALRTMLERLAARPTPEQWHGTIAEALDDRALQLGFHDPATDRFRELDGGELARPAPTARRVWVPVHRGGQPVAAMVIDETLTEDPELVRAAATATLLAVENGVLEGELRDSRARIMSAGQAERRRIERDLHDSAQQRLAALRIHLGLVSEQLGGSSQRAMLERLGAEVEETIDELREVTQGVYPQILAQAGLGGALKAASARFAIPVDVRDGELRRHSEALETTVYFCCLECLQNVVKHAGPGATVTIRLTEDEGRVRFAVEDDGSGFDPATVERGAGLTNLADRVAAIGGTLRIDARPGYGTRITGELPA